MHLRALPFIFAFALFFIGPVAAQNEAEIARKLNLQPGPMVGNLGAVAEIRVPEGYVFADAEATKKILTAMENPLGGQELGIVAPPNLDWFLLFEFDDIGYVKDDEKDSLDANALLESIKKGKDEGNEERKRKGWETIEIAGWEQTPRYNPTTHNLEWGIRATSKEGPTVNWNTRLLGRNGVMKVTLVADPKVLADTMPRYESLLTGFVYKPGGRYAEFKQGDKIAQYGLSALVVGGVAAAAVKFGLFKYLGKFIVFIIAGIGAAIRGVMGFFGKKNQES